MYTHKNYKTKKDLKSDLAAGVAITYYQPGLDETPLNGRITLCGPHYPSPHKWYAEADVKDGKVIKVK